MASLVKVAEKKDLLPGKAMAVTVGNKMIAVFNVGGEFYAIDNECSHASGPLCDGELEKKVVTCPWHGAQFDLTTGEALSAPAFDKLNTYKIHLSSDEISVEVPS